MTFHCLISIQHNRFGYSILRHTLFWLLTPPHHTHSYLLPQALTCILQLSSPLCTHHVILPVVYGLHKFTHMLGAHCRHLPPYLKQEFAGVLCTVEQFYCSYIIATSFVCVVSMEICRVAQDRKQGVNPDPSSNQDEVSRGICGLRVKEELSTYSESHFRVKCALKQERKDPLVLCRASLRPNVYVSETTGLTFCCLSV